MDSYEERLIAVEERSKSNSHRIDALEKKQDSFAKTEQAVALMLAEQEHIKNDVAEIKGDVKEIMSKSGKRWESVVEKMILCVVSAIAGYILIRIGLG